MLEFEYKFEHVMFLVLAGTRATDTRGDVQHTPLPTSIHNACEVPLCACQQMYGYAVDYFFVVLDVVCIVAIC
jgi:hypothetical protein